MISGGKLNAGLDQAKSGRQGETRSGPATEAEIQKSTDTLRGRPGLAMIGLLLVEMTIGYEWLVSGVTKVVRGGFPSGLAGELVKKSVGTPPWYGTLIKSAFIPHSQVFGYVIEIAEALAGIALFAGPFIWLCRWDRVSDRARAVVLFSIAIAAIGGTFLAINLHLASGASHPWLIPGTGFDEGIDLDSVLPAIQIVITAVSIIFLKRLRQKPFFCLFIFPRVPNTTRGYFTAIRIDCGENMKFLKTRVRQRGLSFAALLVLLAVLSSTLSVAVYGEKVEQLSPQGYVNDFAGVLDADSRQKLTALDQEIDQKAGAQIAVVTIRTLEGDNVQNFASRLFKRWGVGPKGKDRGVMILMAVNERQYWTEVGYGLEPILPDGKVGGFGREMVPLLRQNQYGTALLQMTTQVAEVIAQDRGVTLSQGAPPPPQTQGQYSSSGKGAGLVGTIIILALFLGWPLMAFLFSLTGWSRYRRGHGYYGGWWMGSMGHGGGSSGGGFGGFGGGSSGGGGAGGGW